MLVRPADPAVLLTGRIDRSDPSGPQLVWQGTQARIRFSGAGRVGAVFSDVRDRNFYTVIVDGRESLLRLETGAHDEAEYALADGLLPGAHEALIFKRSEALFGSARFRGFLLPDGAAPGPAPDPLPRALELYGDSITAGACNGDSGTDQYDDLSTHDHYRAYGAIAARELGAEYSCIAVSGTGICRSWNPVLMPEVYDRIRPDAVSPRYAFDCRPPDAVVVNLGQNDFGFPNSRGEPFPEDFSEKYSALIRGIRSLYPAAWIICAIGGMSAYRESPDLQAAFRDAVGGLEDRDARVRRLVFQAESPSHPRIDVHERLARELVEFLSTGLDGLAWPARRPSSRMESTIS